MSDKTIRVLLVEHSTSDARHIRQMLDDASQDDPTALTFDLTRATKLSTGQKQLAKGGIDVILLDPSLPDTQGLDALATLHTEARGVPIVLLSDLQNTTPAIKAVSKGVHDHLIKGQTSRDLLVRSLRYAAEWGHNERAWRQAEKALGRLRSLVEHTSDAVFCYECDPPIPTDLPVEEQVRLLHDCILVECNDTCARSYGAAQAQEVIGKKLTDLFGTQPGSLDKLFTALLQGGYRVIDGEGVEMPEDGTKRYYSSNGYGVVEDGMLLRVWGSFRDTTEQKQANEELLESRRELRAVFDQTYEFMGVLKLDGTLTEANQTALDFAGVEASDVIGKPFWETVWWTHSPELQERLRNAVEQAASGEFVRFVANHPAPDGTLHYADFSLKPVKDETGNVSFLISEGRDITDRIQAEAARAQIEETLRVERDLGVGILDALVDTVFVFDPQTGKPLRWNRAFAEISGYSDEEISSRKMPDDWYSTQDLELAAAATESLLRGKKPLIEMALLTKDGREVPTEYSAAMVKDAQGDSRYAVAVVGRDLTQRKLAEAALLRATREWEEIFQAIGHPTLILDPQHGIIAANRATEEILGRPQQEIVGQCCCDIFHGTVDPPDGCPLESLLDCSSLETVEMEMEALGETFLVSCTPVLDENGDLEKVIHLATDVTDLKRAGRALRRERDLVNRIMETNPAGITVVNRDGRITFANAQAEKVLGLTEDAITQRTYDDPEWHITGYDGEPFSIEQLPFPRVMATGQSVFDVRHAIEWPDGKRVLLSINAAPLMDERGQVDGMVATVENVTERVRAEEEMRKSEHMLAESQRVAHLGSWEWDVRRDVIHWSEEQRRIFGLEQEEDDQSLDDVLQLCHPDDVDRLREDIRKGLAGEAPADFDVRIVWPDGSIRRIQTRAEVDRDDHGEPVRVLGTTLDITERVRAEDERARAEEALRESEERFRALVQNSSDITVILEPDATVRYASPALERILGYEPNAIIGENPFDYIHPEDIATMQRQMSETLAHPGMPVSSEFRLRHADGSWLYVETIGSSLLAQPGIEGIVVNARDITERRQAEKALRESEVWLKSTIESLPFDFFALDADGVYLLQNSVCRTRWGDIVGKRPEDIAPSETVSAQWAANNRRAFSGETVAEEVEWVYGGQRAFNHNIISPVYVDDQVRGIVGVNIDITERVHSEQERARAEEALRESLQTAADIVEAIPSGLFIYQHEPPDRLVLLDGNPEAEHLTGVEVDEWRGREFDESWPQAGATDMKQAFLNVMKTGKTFETGDLQYAGERLEGAFRIRAFTMPADRLGVAFENITERVRTEDARARAQQQIERLNLLQGDLLAPGSLTEKLDAITENVVAIFDADFARIWITQPGDLCETDCVHARVTEGPHVCRYRDRCLHLLSSSGRYTHIDGEMHQRVPFGCYKIGRVASGEEPKFITNDVLHDPRVHDHEWASELGLASFAGYQLKSASGKIVGVLALFSRHPLSPDEDALLEGLANMTAQMVQTAQAEDALERSEATLRSIFRVAPVGIGLVSDRVLLWVNDLICEMLGHSSDELIGKSARVLYPSDAEYEYVGREKYAQIGKYGTGTVETRWQHKNGMVIDVLLSSTPIDPSDLSKGVTFTALDITERVRSEQERAQAEAERQQLLTQIQEQAQQLQQVMDTVPAGVILLGDKGRIILANPLGDKHLAILADTLVGGTLTRLGNRPLPAVLTSPPQGLWHDIATEGREFQVIARPIETGPTSTGWVLVIRDVTEQRGFERRSQQQERLAALGQLAAGIAHDFNNIMAVITLYASMSLKSLDEPSKVSDRLEIIDQQARRASELIQQIMDFSRRAVLERGPMDLLMFAKEQTRLLQRTLPENIRVNLKYGKDDYTIQADPTRIQQVMMNLATNARDAMPEGGGLHIALDRIQIETDTAPPMPEMNAGDWVCLKMTDTGVGIPEDVLPHIFDPFFTTKESGKGTGLGLAQVYGIVKQHEGHIDVSTGEEEGTTFVIYLPALSVDQPEGPTPELQELPRGEGATILVVEDDATTRAAIVSGLELLGYQVMETDNGQEALEAFEQHASEIALVLSDMVMPEMGGRVLFRQLSEQDPHVKVMLMSGHPLEEAALEELRDEGLRGWLPKPLDLARLAETIAEALAETK